MNILFARTFSLLVFTVVSFSLLAQPKINVLDSGHKVSIRGLSVVDDHIIWASGSSGTVAKSMNGGKSFAGLKVKGYETRDFRDVEAFSADTALIMAVDVPALILKTYDGGNTWKEVFRDTTPGMFLDAMDFNGKYGAVVGDPINDYAFIAYTDDFGEHWTGDYTDKKGHIKNIKIKLQKNEAFFASSGTNVKIFMDGIVHEGDLFMATGGGKSSLAMDNSIVQLPIIQGSSSQGANSIDIFGTSLVVVGGDYAHDTITRNNCVLFDLKNEKMRIPQTPPHGYRSCVIYLNKNKLITCGTSGVDVSNDGGLNWQLISRQSFHVCQKAKNGSAVFLAGANGKIAVYR
jgi:hypothetical protein